MTVWLEAVVFSWLTLTAMSLLHVGWEVVLGDGPARYGWLLATLLAGPAGYVLYLLARTRRMAPVTVTRVR